MLHSYQDIFEEKYQIETDIINKGRLSRNQHKTGVDCQPHENYDNTCFGLNVSRSHRKQGRQFSSFQAFNHPTMVMNDGGGNMLVEYI